MVKQDNKCLCYTLDPTFLKLGQVVYQYSTDNSSLGVGHSIVLTLDFNCMTVKNTNRHYVNQRLLGATSWNVLIIQLGDENFSRLPSPIFCDLPLNYLFITNFKSFCCSAYSRNIPNNILMARLQHMLF